MADRTVSVELTADVGDLVAKLNLAGSAVDRFNQKVDGAAKDTGQAFTRTSRDVAQSTSQISADLGALSSTSAGFASKTEEQNLRAALAAQKFGLAAKEATEKAAAAQEAAAVSADRLAAGEIDVEEHAALVARAEREVERATIRATEAQLAASAAARKLDEDTQRVTDSFGNTDKTASLMRGELASLTATAVGIAPPFIAAGAAAGAFAAVAAPSIKQVFDAQKDLNAGWSTLDKGQQAASQHLNDLINQYKALADAYEPQALAVFNDLLGDTSVLMQRARPLMDAGALGVQHFTGAVDSFVTGGEMTRFLDFASRNAGPAFDQLGQTFTETGTLALNLAQDLGPMGMTLLTAANGGLKLLNVVEQVDPHLAEMAVTALALRAPTQKLGELWTNNASKLSKLAKEGSSAESFLGKLGKTVGASPNLYIGAALAIGYVVARLATMKDSTDNLIAAVRTENSAIGNNVQGHLQAAASFGKYISQARAAEKAALADGVAENSAQSITERYGNKIEKLTEARKDELAAAHNVADGEQLLHQQYGISTEAARQLATAAGVDLSKGITGSGDAARAAQAKIRGYYNSVKQAQDSTYQITQALTAAGNSTLALKDRMTALANAFGVLAGPELQAFDTTTRTAQAFDQFDAAMKKSKGSMSLTTSAGQSARAAFAGLLSTVQSNIDAQYQYNQATQGAAKAMQIRTASARSLLPVLLAEAGGNKAATRAILDWANAAGVGKTRAQAMASTLGLTKSAFLAAAQGAGKSRAEAEKLWAAFNKIPAVKNTKINSNATARRKEVEDYQAKLDALHGKTVTINDNAAAAQARVNRVQQAINALHNRTVTITTRHIIDTIEIAHRTSQAEHAHADGGIDRYAAGGIRRDLDPFIAATPTVLFGETSTGGEAFIPLGPNKRQRSTELLSQVAGMFGLEVVKPNTLRRYDDGAAGSRHLGEFVRRLIPAGPVSRPITSAATSGGGVTLNQTIYAQQMNPQELARNVARETAWTLT